MDTTMVHLVIDDAVVADATDVFTLIEPLWERVEIYDSWARYEASLKPFSENQRHLFAIQWYRAEVKNGGHDQFFLNSTGIVCEHAIEGFVAIGLTEAADILTSASKRIGGASRDRGIREMQVDAARADLEDLDQRFFKLERTGVLDDLMLAFARRHAADFRFVGTIEVIRSPHERADALN